jgi:3-hydroxyisobutyrate dehydrogenase-like beta-hydroxyacid dehydrogenase
MKPVVAIVAAGNMGAAMGRRLTDHGVQVLTSLAGRGEASAARARDARMEPAEDAAIAASDLLLSVVPPAEAVALAERFAPAIREAATKCVYVDCNAIDPGTARRVAAIVEAAGARFVDGGIIGMPPAPGTKGTILYVSGEQASEVASLTAFGLEVRVLDKPVGAASALKMSYAGITKGFTAMGTGMLLAAAREGTADDLMAELAASQPNILAWLSRMVPNMFPKAYRWVAEMEEIATFVSDDPATAQFYRGAAQLYARLAADHAGERRETGALEQVLAKRP